MHCRRNYCWVRRIVKDNSLWPVRKLAYCTSHYSVTFMHTRIDCSSPDSICGRKRCICYDLVLLTNVSIIFSILLPMTCRKCNLFCDFLTVGRRFVRSFHQLNIKNLKLRSASLKRQALVDVRRIKIDRDRKPRERIK